MLSRVNRNTASKILKWSKFFNHSEPIISKEVHKTWMPIDHLKTASMSSIENNHYILFSRIVSPRLPSPSSLLPLSVRFISSSPRSQFAEKQTQNNEGRRRSELVEKEDVFDSLGDEISHKPVTVAEGASYSILIIAGFAFLIATLIAAFQTLIFESKEYTVFNKALDRVKMDSRILMKLGTPIIGYGDDSRNRHKRRHINHRIWNDEEGIEHIQIEFHIRGPNGAGIVQCEMFKDAKDKGKLKFTYLMVDVTSPAPSRIMLESYIPA